MILNDIEPKNVMKYFEEISSIPRGSGNVKKISDYLENFAVTEGLKYIRDEWDNIVIFKDATPGYEGSPGVIIQGHMDMVCEKTEDTDIDMEKDGLRLKKEGDYIYAEGTTLGGDDGIAVAYGLAILASDDIKHPNLEVVFTVDEEIGMIGASKMDMSVLKGKYLLNIDSEEEGHVLVSCAGGATLKGKIGFEKDAEIPEYIFTLKVTGLKGGHSGTEINKGRANANIIAAKIIKKIMDSGYGIKLCSFSGGNKDNAIPNAAEVSFGIDGNFIRTGKNQEEILDNHRDNATKKAVGLLEELRDIAAKEAVGLLEELRYIATKEAARLLEEYRTGEDEINVAIDIAVNDNTVKNTFDAVGCVTKEDSKKIISSILEIPNGVIKESEDIEGLVETSLNLGILRLNMPGNFGLGETEDFGLNDAEDFGLNDTKDFGLNDAEDFGLNENKDLKLNGEPVLELCYSVRSSVDEDKEKLLEKVSGIIKNYGGDAVIEGDYPGWQYNKDSKLRDIMNDVYRDMYGKELRFEAIHAGVECGFFSGNIPDLDCVSFGPDIYDIHTVREKMSMSSVERVWNYIIKLLEKIG